MKIFTFLISIILLSSCIKHTDKDNALKGTVIKVADGDTFTLLTDDKQQVKVRLHGIDAPEHYQAFSKQSRQFLNDMVYDKKVSVKVMSKDRYGRSVGIVFVGTVNVNEEMLKAGLAWHYVKYDNNSEWAKLELEARENKIGIWSEEEPIAPWDFRKIK